MGADSTIVFYGIRFPTDDSESDSLQKRTDPRIVRARSHQLAHWRGSFSLDEGKEQSYLFIGSLVGNIGHEGKYEICLKNEDLDSLITTTQKTLSEANFEGEARLYIQFEPDY